MLAVELRRLIAGATTSFALPNVSHLQRIGKRLRKALDMFSVCLKFDATLDTNLCFTLLYTTRNYPELMFHVIGQLVLLDGLVGHQ